jgi:hypothetical protein
MCKRFLPAVVVVALLVSLFVPAAGAQQRGRGAVCGDPTASCRTGDLVFQPYDLPFRIPARAVIWETEQFYAVILKSVRVADEFGDCERFVSEEERLAAQALFPANKVFASRCAEPGGLYYTNTDPKTRFIAAYAGRTRAEAAGFLARVKATGKYPGANLRRMRAGFNGT